MGPKEAWELITTLLKLAKRLETVLVLVGTGAWYVLTDLYTTESLFGRESRVLLVIAGLLAILALAISLKEQHADAWKPFIIAGAPVNPRSPVPANERFKGNQPAGVLVTFVQYVNPPGLSPIERVIVYGELSADGKSVIVTCVQGRPTRRLCELKVHLDSNQIDVIQLDLLRDYWLGRDRAPPSQRCIDDVTKAERERRNVGDLDIYGRLRVHLIALERCRSTSRP